MNGNPYRMGDARLNGRHRDLRKDKTPAETLESALGGLAEVRSYEIAREPILSKMVRIAIRQWLLELSSEKELLEVGASPRKKILLEGPPGTGKTTLAHHMAARLGVPLVMVGPENLVSKYLGDTGKSVAGLFDKIKEAGQKCVLFIDEIDALGASRDGMGDGSCSQEMRSAMTVLLRRFEEHDGLVMAATNRPGSIDPALWRRFDAHLNIDLPGHDERWAILKLYSQPFDLHDDAIHLLAEITEGASPALLEGLMVGLKRALIINPKMKVSVDDPCTVFLPIIESLTPPPEMEMPLLWKQVGIHKLDALKEFWPPKRQNARPDAA